MAPPEWRDSTAAIRVDLPRAGRDQYPYSGHPPAHTAILFPGQGSQTSGMAAVTAAQRPDLLEQAREELGADPFEQIAEGTHFAQPALYCASLAHWKQAGEPRPAC